MAEDPDLATLEGEFPALRRAVLTRGEPYDQPILDDLHAFVRRAFALPRFQSGIEAFVRCAPAEPLAVLRGWRAFACALRDPAGGITTVDDALLRAHDGDLMVDRRGYGDDLHAALCAAGERIGASGGPRLFLLWTNSD